MESLHDPERERKKGKGKPVSKRGMVRLVISLGYIVLGDSDSSLVDGKGEEISELVFDDLAFDALNLHPELQTRPRSPSI